MNPAADYGDTGGRARSKRDRLRPVMIALRATPDGAELSQEAVGKAVGCSEKLVWTVEQDPAYWRDVHDTVLTTERAHIGGVYRALRGQALKGDVQAVRLYLSQVGVLRAEQLEMSGSVDVTGSAQWRELRGTILAAIDRFPQARDQLLAALEGARDD